MNDWLADREKDNRERDACRDEVRKWALSYFICGRESVWITKLIQRWDTEKSHWMTTWYLYVKSMNLFIRPWGTIF